jgi:hypothetical protein
MKCWVHNRRNWSNESAFKEVLYKTKYNSNENI